MSIKKLLMPKEDINYLDFNYLDKKNKDSINNKQDSSILSFIDKLLNSKYNDVSEQEFKISSERLYRDLLNLLLLDHLIASPEFISKISTLYDFYRDLYKSKKSPLIRLYQGKFSAIKMMYETSFQRSNFLAIYENCYEIRKIIDEAYYNGKCKFKFLENQLIKKNLDWLESANIINIIKFKEFTVKLSITGRKIYESSILVQDAMSIRNLHIYVDLSKKHTLYSGRNIIANPLEKKERSSYIFLSLEENYD